MAVQTVCVTKIKKRLKNLWETKSIQILTQCNSSTHKPEKDMYSNCNKTCSAPEHSN